MRREIQIGDIRCSEYDKKRFRIIEIDYILYLNSIKTMTGTISVCPMNQEDLKDENIINSIIELGEDDIAYRIIKGQ